MLHGVYEGHVNRRSERDIYIAIGDREAFIEIADRRLVDVRPGDPVRSTWRDDRPVSATITASYGERVSLDLV